MARKHDSSDIPLSDDELADLEATQRAFVAKPPPTSKARKVLTLPFKPKERR